MSELSAARQRRRSEQSVTSAKYVGGRLLTAAEACARLGVGRTTLHRLAKEVKLTPVHIGRCARYLESEVDAYIEQLCVEARRGQLRAATQ